MPVFLFALVVFVAWIVVLSCTIMARGRRTAPDDLDVVIVLGAQVMPDGAASPTLKLRIDAAANYLHAHPACRCIVSGGKVGTEGRSEASCMNEGLLAQGVDAGRITLEERSTTTVENMRFSKALLEPGERVGIVTSNFHLYRALGIARREGIEGARGVPAPSSRRSLVSNLLRECGCLALGFFNRHFKRS